jgi:hypothetical protein
MDTIIGRSTTKSASELFTHLVPTVIARSSELLRRSVRTWFVNSGNHEACPTLATLRRLAPAAFSSLRLSVHKSVRAKSAHAHFSRFAV